MTKWAYSSNSIEPWCEDNLPPRTDWITDEENTAETSSMAFVMPKDGSALIIAEGEAMRTRQLYFVW